jgi:hypothetical protein
MLMALPLVVLGLVHLELSPWKSAAVHALVGVSVAISLLGCMYQDFLFRGLPDMMQSAIPSFAGLLFTRGPRVPLLDFLGTAPWIQALVCAGYVSLAAATFARKAA